MSCHRVIEFLETPGVFPERHEKADAVKKRVTLKKSEEPSPRNDVEELLAGLRSVLVRSGRRKFTTEEKEKILAVVRVLVS